VGYIFVADSMGSSANFRTVLSESRKRQPITLPSPKQILTQNGGGAEFAGPENDGPKKIKDWKMQDLKMTDQIAGLENAGPGK